MDDDLWIVLLALYDSRLVEPLVVRLEDSAARTRLRLVECVHTIDVDVRKQIIGRPIVLVGVNLAALAPEGTRVRHVVSCGRRALERRSCACVLRKCAEFTD